MSRDSRGFRVIGVMVKLQVPESNGESMCLCVMSHVVGDRSFEFAHSLTPAATIFQTIFQDRHMATRDHSLLTWIICLVDRSERSPMERIHYQALLGCATSAVQDGASFCMQKTHYEIGSLGGQPACQLNLSLSEGEGSVEHLRDELGSKYDSLKTVSRRLSQRDSWYWCYSLNSSHNSHAQMLCDATWTIVVLQSLTTPEHHTPAVVTEGAQNQQRYPPETYLPLPHGFPANEARQRWIRR
ncbi:hypothetical protein C8Q74DRAFT_1215214 [Fomes fomentarius]|nr:hypothetical protein C8Q74DRAFT_1215214 [Fomes fomentarius]